MNSACSSLTTSALIIEYSLLTQLCGFPWDGQPPVPPPEPCAGRRWMLLGWAEDKPERYIIEDDYDSEFRFSHRPVPVY